MKLLIALFAVCLFFSLTIHTVHAQQNHQFVTIVNPVRISPNATDPQASLKAQYSQVHELGLPATWLYTYDALADNGIFALSQEMDAKQEKGIFLEVSPQLAQAAQVVYNKSDSWHFANSLFLSGYTQQDRRRLIDTVFEEYKQRFSNYPSSVGAWWVDSYSLEYMRAKYNVIANLTVTDQYSTDGYEVWGQYWSVPFYPSRYHAAMPARTLANKLDVVTMQWAARDPLNAYGEGKASLYSIQDYVTLQLPSDYFEKVVQLYIQKQKNQYGQITIGLESDLPAGVYSGEYSRQLSYVKGLESQNVVTVTTMSQFSDWYRSTFPHLSPPHIVQADDLLGTKKKIFWYQSPVYRIALQFDEQTEKLRVIDFRTYHDDVYEPYYASPNSQPALSIITPSLIDTTASPSDRWEIASSPGVYAEGDTHRYIIHLGKGGDLLLEPDKITVPQSFSHIPRQIQTFPAIRITRQANQVLLYPEQHWIVGKNGIVKRGLSIEATYFLVRKKIVLGLSMVVVFLVITIKLLMRSSIFIRQKTRVLIGMLLLTTLTTAIWYWRNSHTYSVSQSEVDGLYRLAIMPWGKVLVYNNVCLQCSWYSQYRPAVFVNKRSYVADLSKKPIVISKALINPSSRAAALDSIKGLRVRYVYLVKLGQYKEQLPFSPGDLHATKLYENAQSELWQIEQ